MTNKLTMRLLSIAKEFDDKGLKLYYVGGTVRDMIMGNVVEDVDICIVGSPSPETVTHLLNQLVHNGLIGNVTSQVGESFPVWIAEILGNKVDFAMARTEKLVGDYRTDFTCGTQGVTIEEDLRRRDFTINAIAKDVITGEIIDPYDGNYHIRTRLLCPVSEAFKEDSLRVLRGARFCARFDLTPSWSFYDYAWELKPTDISPERVGMELMKTMQQATVPSTFFRVLKSCGWLRYHFKALDNLNGVQQEPDYHPEGDAFVHTLLSIDEAKDWFTRIVMACHDLGKALKTTFNVERNRWQSIGHEEAGVSLAREMLSNIHFANKKTIRQIETLVLLHMTRIHVSEKTVRGNLRILERNGLTYDQLVEVVRCDVSSRPPLPKYTPDIGQARAKEIVEQGLMIPVVTGERLKEKGIEPGPWMGWLVKKGLELQDRGTLNEENWWKVLNNFKQTDNEKNTDIPGVKEEKNNGKGSPVNS